MANIKFLVPSRMSAISKTKGGRGILQIAQYHYDKQKNVYDYLISLTEPANEILSGNMIEFYDKHAPYYEFTNFYPAPIELDEKIWPMTEHYFQASKFPCDQSLQESIRIIQNPKDAFNFARAHDKDKRSDWESVKDDIMKKALLAKFTQHQNLQQLLLMTGNAHLVEASPVDAYWGYGSNKQGKNMLGRLLMELRDHLKISVTSISHSIPVNSGTSAISTADEFYSLQNALNAIDY